MATASPRPDTITIRDLKFNSVVGPDRWGKVRAQPITLTVHVETCLRPAGASDAVRDSVHYGELCKQLLADLAAQDFRGLAALADAAAAAALAFSARVDAVRVRADAHNQFLMAESLGVSIYRPRLGGAAGPSAGDDTVVVRDLRLGTIIGVNPQEREWKQVVVTTVTFHSPAWGEGAGRGAPDWHAIHAGLTEAVEASLFLTLEAFAAAVARAALGVDGARAVTVRAQKPGALPFAHSSGVEITRCRADFASGAPGPSS